MSGCAVRLADWCDGHDQKQTVDSLHFSPWKAAASCYWLHVLSGHGAAAPMPMYLSGPAWH
eukprot:1147153-Pelagomonas_calceolata.AAC.1